MSGMAAPSGGSDLQSQILDYHNTIKAIAQTVKINNPGISPRDLFKATELVIGQMKGVKDEAKDYMRAQIDYARLQAKQQDDMARLQARMEETLAKIQGAKDVANIRGDTARATTQMRDETSMRNTDARDSVSMRNTDVRAQTSMRNTDARGSGAGGVLGALKAEKALEGTELGKTYKRTETAGGEIEDLASKEDVYTNATAQLGLINRYLYMTTGSTRPPLAELKKITDAKDANDLYQVITKKPGSAPLLGRDQIQRIVHSARAIREGAKARAMKDPLTARALKEIEGGGPSPAGQDYLTVDDAGKAFQRGEISEAQFRAIAKRMGHK